MLDRPSAPFEAELTPSWQMVAETLSVFDGLLLAVSGGPDSLAMLHGLAKLRASGTTLPDMRVVTVDHDLRSESAREAVFVCGVCKELGLTHKTVRLAQKPEGANLQAWARNQRYRVFADEARIWKPDARLAVVTAHTADDQAETVLMRAARGAGSEALAAIRPETRIAGVHVVRPFLDWRREHLHSALPPGSNPVIDPSNSNDRFTRVRYRNWLAEAPEPDSARSIAHGLAETARIARLESDALDHEAEKLLHVIGGGSQGYASGRVALDVVPLAIAARFVRRAMLTVARAADAAQRLDMARMVEIAERVQRESTGKCVLAGSVFEWSRSADGLDILAYAEAGRAGFPDIQVVAGQTAIWDGRFEIINQSQRACTVRAWRSGDGTPMGFDVPKRVLASLPVALLDEAVVAGPGTSEREVHLRFLS